MNEGNVMERLEKAEWVLQNSGFRRCDIPACNCNSWHQVGGYAERFREIKEAVEEAGHSTNGKILLDVVKEILDRAARESAPVAQAAPASPQEVQESCAQVADRAAERPLEVTPGVMARNIARGIRALIPPAAQASPDQHDATYLRGWNEGIERAVEALEKEGWYTPQETIRTLIETSPVPSAAGSAQAAPDSLRAAAERVCWFDWSDNDMDACAAMDALRKALTVPSASRGTEA